MSGIIVINKPKGYTSRDIVNIVSKNLGIKKVGHTGTLDPLATGVLVICVGKYTKLVDLLSSLHKEYIAEIKLGVLTDTLDITGNIIEEKQCMISKLDILKSLAKFRGEYLMEVPKYSAIKVKGKKLYEYARNNEDVKLPIKKVHIYELELLSFYKDIISFRCLVEKGTYIRSLIRDITNDLNVLGTMNNLVRIKQGKFKIEDAYSIDDIKQNNYKLLKIKDVLDIKEYILDEQEYKKVKNGNHIEIISNEEILLLLYENEEIAIYKKENQLYKAYIMLV